MALQLSLESASVSKLCFQNEYLTKELSNKERELELHKTQFQIKCKFFGGFWFVCFFPSISSHKCIIP